MGDQEMKNATSSDASEATHDERHESRAEEKPAVADIDEPKGDDAKKPEVATAEEPETFGDEISGAGIDEHVAGNEGSVASSAVKDPQEKKRGKVTPLVVVLVIVIVACLCGGVAGGMYLVSTYAQIRDVENSQSVELKLPSDIAANDPNPVDFKSLDEQNPDIYAWIYIPGTDISFPVCQRASDDTFYLNHNVKGEESELGAIFTEAQYNHTDFQDPVTVLYGHNGFGDTMFTHLHDYESSEFLEKNDKAYIYCDGHVYTYKIFSAFMSDDAHLMAKYNFQTEEGMNEFIAGVQNPLILGINTLPVEVSAHDKFIVLSTCNTGALDSVGRYLVCGVMVDDQPTK